MHKHKPHTRSTTCQSRTNINPIVDANDDVGGLACYVMSKVQHEQAQLPKPVFAANIVGIVVTYSYCRFGGYWLG